jgi:hypothetical protein
VLKELILEEDFDSQPWPTAHSTPLLAVNDNGRPKAMDLWGELRVGWGMARECA